MLIADRYWAKGAITMATINNRIYLFTYIQVNRRLRVV